LILCVSSLQTYGMNSRFNRISEKYNFDGFTQFSSAMFGPRQAVELMV